VRRSSDDAEDSFTAAEVSDGTLAAFCGAGDGFVTTWHSQTGSNNATQSTAASQPKIVSSGVVILDDGHPVLQFDGSDDYLVATGYKPSGAVFAVLLNRIRAFTTSNQLVLTCHKTSAPSGGFVFNCADSSGTRDKIRAQTGLGGSWIDGANVTSTVQYPSEIGICLLKISGSGTLVGLNGIDVASDSAGEIAAGQDLNIGRDVNTGGGYSQLNAMELIVWNTDLSSQRELIEGNIAWSYSV